MIILSDKGTGFSKREGLIWQKKLDSRRNKTLSRQFSVNLKTLEIDR
jgi:hypothetical protein